MVESDLSERIARVEAQLAIQQLAVRYARAVDARDIDGLTQLYTEEIDFSAFGYGKGRQAVRDFFDSDGILTSFYRSMHQVCGHVIDLIDADSAKGTVYCRVEHEDGEDWIIQLMVYFDTYRRVDGTWLFDHRKMTYLHTGDIRKAPQEVNFNNWPGWVDGDKFFTPTLPHLWPSWDAFWQRHPDFVQRRTKKP